MKITKINSVEPKAFNGMDKTWVVDDNGIEGYTFMRVTVGGDVNGYWATDKGGNNILKKSKDQPAASGGSSSREYKSDPAKMELGQWQTSLIQGRQSVRDWYEINILAGKKLMIPSLEGWKKEVVNAAITYATTLEVKPHNLVPEEAIEAEEPEVEVEAAPMAEDLPPVEVYNEPPF